MTARRALEALDAEFVAEDFGTPRRAQVVARRAAAETVDEAAPARRTLVESLGEVELIDFEPAVTPVAASAAPARAFQTVTDIATRRHPRRRIALGVSLAAMIGSASTGAMIARSAADTTSATIVEIERDASISRSTDRTALSAGLAASETLTSTEATTQSFAEAAGLPSQISMGEIISMADTFDPAAVTASGQRTPDSVAQAMATAESMVGNQNYTNMCLALVSRFYGYTSAGIESAQAAAGVIQAAGQMHTDMTDIPVGALIWYDGTPIGNPYGHVAMYAGNGMVYSNGAPTGVGLISIDEPASGWGEPIIGWSSVWLPSATR